MSLVVSFLCSYLFGATTYQFKVFNWLLVVLLVPGLKETICIQRQRIAGPQSWVNIPSINPHLAATTGYTCQSWAEHSPHGHSYDAWAADQNHNQCRDPWGSDGFIWCYTTDPDVRWDYCDYGVDDDAIVAAIAASSDAGFAPSFDHSRRVLGELGSTESDWCPDTLSPGGFDGCTARGTDYESWSEMPHERERLLRLVQRALQLGTTRAIVFVSGDQHWAEFSAKTIPETALGAADSQTVYELTASGLAANWVRDLPFYNDNRLPSTRCDTRADGDYVNSCQFPFVFDGVSYSSCTMAGNRSAPWCLFDTSSDGTNIGANGKWGQCGSFVNNAPSNYGELEFDFANETVLMKIWTPGKASATAGLADEFAVPFAVNNHNGGSTCTSRGGLCGKTRTHGLRSLP
jgi:hypothetical protein